MATSRIPKLLNVVSTVIHDDRFAHGTFEEALTYIVEYASEALDCQRVSAWEYHTTPNMHIQCLDLWDRKEKSHTKGALLNEENASTYLNSLTKDLVISMDDVKTDPRCIELNSAYLPQHEITSMLDAPFQYDGELAGVLCFEHTGKKRTWSAEEQNFAANMAGLLSILTERVKRHLAEKQLYEEKDRYLQLFHNSPYGIAIIADGRVELVNPALAKIVETVGLENIQGKMMKDIFSPSQHENLSQAQKAMDREKEIIASANPLLPMEYQLILNDGSTMYFGVSSRHITWQGKDAILSNIHDITEAVNNRKSLEQHAAQLQTLADSFPGGFSYVNKDLVFILVNDILCQWFDTTADEIIGKALPEYMGAELFKPLKTYTDMALAGKNVTFEWVMRHPAAGKREVQFTFVPDLDERNEVKGFFSFILDLTDTKNYERNLRHAQKMEAVGQLTGGIAHDFNNLLMIIMGNLEIMSTEVESGNALGKYVNNALQASTRGAQLTSKLLGFSSNKSSYPDIININDSIENMSSLLNKSLSASIKLELQLTPDLHLVNVNAGDLEDSLLNLSLNSRDAMQGSGTLTITTQNRRKNNVEYVVLSVTDTGEGIDAESRDKVYEPFFTTKPEGKGSGLGLSMVYGFVKRSNAEINLISEKGKGTTFELYFPPAQSDKPSQPKQTQPRKDSPGGLETILVVDDEKDLLATVTQMLKMKGYNTLSANSAQEALSLISSDKQQIDLIFTDIVLGGGMDGYELALQCLEQRPMMKILLTTGYDKLDNNDRSSEFVSSSSLLKKPYQMDELNRSIRYILDTGNSA